MAMAASLAPTLTKKEFHNWLKGALVLLFTKDGLIDFVSAEVDQLHQCLLQLVPTTNSQNTCTCTINSLPQCSRSRTHGHTVTGPRHSCSRGVCNILMDGICKQHRYRGPSWNNTDPKKWSTDAFEIAKCFMAPDGYSKKTSLAETDFNGIISVIINNTSFESKLQANLRTDPNICTKAQKIGREIRHSPDHLLSDSDLTNYIDDLINLLCDPVCLVHDPSAHDAVKKLRMLKINDLTIHEKDLTEALNDSIKDTFSDQHKDFLQKIQDHYFKLQTDSVSEIDRITAVRRTELEELTSKLTENITRHAEIKKQEIEKKCDQRRKEKTIEEKQKDLKEDLISHYINNEARIPVVPLVENRTVPLTDFYVRPKMLIRPIAFGLEKRTSEKACTNETVNSFHDLLTKEDNNSYKQVYIEAPAGCGKTSFSQSMAITWCQAHKPDQKLTSKFSTEDLDAMKPFDILFLLHLRDYQNFDKCILDDLIFEMVSSTLARRTQYTQPFLEDILNEQRCIVILDGLDEWPHPVRCGRKPEIPHNNHHHSCTVICTTRPWKISCLGLAGHIDRHVEISELDEESSKVLEINALQILNESQNLNVEKKLSDFHEEVSSLEIDDICKIPYVKLQLISLWFDGFSLGNSRCEVYSNITELTLERAIKQKKIPPIPTSEPKNAVPNFFTNNQACKDYLNSLLKLGKLAFHALFNEIKESSLTFERKTALAYLETFELDFCLTTGLLSQSNDASLVSKVLQTVFFQHKSLQEYFASLYLTTCNKDEEARNSQIILNACKSLPDILEKSNLFVFLCGMNPKMYSDLSWKFHDVVEGEKKTSDYRTTVNDSSICYFYNSEDENSESLQHYQLMQLACFQEAIKNHNEQCRLPLQDIFPGNKKVSDHDRSALIKMMALNTGNIKTLFIREIKSEYQFHHFHILKDFLKSLVPSELQSLQKLVFRNVKTIQVCANIMSSTAPTLKCLELEETFLNCYIPILPNMKNLQAIRLYDVNLAHNDLDSLCKFIEKQIALLQLSLLNLTCISHITCFGVVLDLSQLDRLQKLYIKGTRIKHHQLNPARLEKCEFDGLMFNGMLLIPSLVKLNGAPVLTHLSLTYIEYEESAYIVACIILTLPQLKELYLAVINFRGIKLLLPSQMTQLEKVDLCNIDFGNSGVFLSPQLPNIRHVRLDLLNMSVSAWKELLVDNMCRLSQSVKVELIDIHSLSLEEWEDIVKTIKSICPSTQFETIDEVVDVIMFSGNHQ